MKALKGEHLIKELNSKQIKLTNYRVRFYENNFAYTSVMLDKISAISVTYQENKRYLHLAIVLFASVFIAARVKFNFEIPLALSALFYLLYIFNKKKNIYINSEGNQSVQFSVSGLKSNEIDDFIDEVENQSFKLKKIIE